MRRSCLDRRKFLASGVAVAATRLALPACAEPRIVMNDASQLNPTPVVKHWRPKTDESDKFIEALRVELKAAAAQKRRVVVGAARHSMGGQSLARDGLAITFDGRSLTPDIAGQTYRVTAGARWATSSGLPRPR